MPIALKAGFETGGVMVTSAGPASSGIINAAVMRRDENSRRADSDSHGALVGKRSPYAMH